MPEFSINYSCLDKITTLNKDSQTEETTAGATYLVTDRKRETMVSVWLLFDFDLILILSRFYAPTKYYIPITLLCQIMFPVFPLSSYLQSRNILYPFLFLYNLVLFPYTLSKLCHFHKTGQELFHLSGF